MAGRRGELFLIRQCQLSDTGGHPRGRPPRQPTGRLSYGPSSLVRAVPAAKHGSTYAQCLDHLCVHSQLCVHSPCPAPPMQGQFTVLSPYSSSPCLFL